jgi:O-antigen ligase
MKRAIALLLFIAFSIASLAILQQLVMRFGIFSNLERFIIPLSHRKILQYGDSYAFDFSLYRSVGTFHHSNLFGIYLAMILPIGVSLLFFVKNRMKRMLLLIIVVFVIVGIFFSGSRGAFLNLLFSTLFLIIIYWKRIPRKTILFTVVCIVASYLVFAHVIKSYFRIGEGLSYRDIIWRNSLEIIKEHPFLGIGVGTFPQQFLSQYSFPSLIDLENTLKEIEITGSSDISASFHAHNQFLNYAAEMGIGAVFLTFVFYAIFISNSYRLIKKLSFNFNYALLTGSSAAVFGNFFHSFFEAVTTFSQLSIGTLFAFIVALAVVSANNLRSGIKLS